MLRSVTDFPLVPTIPRAVSFKEEIFQGVVCEVIVPGRNSIPDIQTALNDGALGICLYLHGGGFALCNPKTHRPITHLLAEKANCVVVVPDYQRMPEYTLGDALGECETVFQVLTKKFKTRVCLVGDSAGGALCVMLAARRRGVAVAAVSLISPWCDFDDEFENLPENFGTQDYLSPHALRVMGEMVQTRAGEGAKSPVEIVQEGEYPEEVPTLVQVGSVETLYNQIIHFSKFVKGCEVREYTNMIHVPHFFSLMHCEARRAVQDLCEFNKKHLDCEIVVD